MTPEQKQQAHQCLAEANRLAHLGHRREAKQLRAEARRIRQLAEAKR